MNELEVLGAVADALCRDDELAVVLDRTLAIVADALELDTGWIWLLDPATARFYLAASLNLPPYLADPVRMTGEPCWCIEAFVDGDFRSKNVGVIACSRLRRAPAADATA
ncbi:MAG: hypothetical protein ACREM6_06150, partial [Vulcanimicrobiaceae bacterium]